MADKKVADIDRGVALAGAKAAAGAGEELFGHVTLVQAYSLSSYVGCHALVALRDTPGKTIALLTSEPRLQSVLETALATGNLMGFWGKKLTCPSTPMGGAWTVDVYGIESVLLYNMK